MRISIRALRHVRRSGITRDPSAHHKLIRSEHSATNSRPNGIRETAFATDSDRMLIPTPWPLVTMHYLINATDDLLYLDSLFKVGFSRAKDFILRTGEEKKLLFTS